MIRVGTMRRAESHSGRRGQRGVALLTAVVLVALATVVATAIAFDTTLAARRGGGGAALEDAQRIAGGAEAAAAYFISDARKAPSIFTGQQWANPIGPVEAVPGTSLEASIVDLQGRFNLNNLTKPDGTVNQDAVDILGDLLENIGVNRSWAMYMADWIDDDMQAGPGGAEDSVYSSETPAYRTPNRVITSPTEMLALKDFDPAIWQQVAPYVTALPRGVGVNLCTASGALLDAMSNQQQWSQSPAAIQSLAANRAGKCFPDAATFKATMSAQDQTRLDKAMSTDVVSDWFQVRTVATIGTSDFALYSLLHHQQGGGNAGGRVSVVTRTFTE